MNQSVRQTRPYRPGVGAVVFARDGRVLVGRRPGIAHESWQFPQGGIDQGETPREALLREVAEEIGTDQVAIVAECADWLSYDLPSEYADRLCGGKYRGQRQKWFALRFTGEDDDIRLDAHHPPEFDAWRWVRLSEAPAFIIDFKRPIYERIVAAFSALADVSPVSGDEPPSR